MDLIAWLNVLEKRHLLYDPRTGKSEDFQLTPVSAIVPWLLVGLREAVMKELVYDLLKIIAVKEGGFRSDELDVIERSLLFGSDFMLEAVI